MERFSDSSSMEPYLLSVESGSIVISEIFFKDIINVKDNMN